MDIPVLLFTGFLDSGKTTFIQSVLHDKEFNKGQRILVLQCEEGEEELLPDQFAKSNVYIEQIEEEEDLSEALLDRLTNKYDAEQILIEYNGMWMLESLFSILPNNWVIASETLFFDSRSFLNYNANMRQLVYNKLRTAEMIIFNRVADTTDKMELHKIVRATTRQANIAYEYESGKTEYDEIVDPPPYDLDAPVVVIEDRDYAFFYQDLLENMKTYHGKKVEFTIFAMINGKMPKNTFIGGRHLMACCANDIQYAAFAFLYERAEDIQNQCWYKVEAEIGVKFTPIYGKKGPVFRVLSIRPTSEPENPVATFY